MPTTNILTTLAPTSVTRVEVLEDDWYVTIVDDDEIIVLQESKTIDVDVGICGRQKRTLAPGAL